MTSPHTKPGLPTLVCPPPSRLALQLSNRLTPDMLFYACLWPFVGFFALFGFLVYPNKELLHPTGKPGYRQPSIP